MNKVYNEKILSNLQESIYTPLLLNDALIEILEICADDPRDASSCPPHTHTWYEFNYITSGNETLLYGEEKHPVHEGYFFMIAPGIEHAHKYNRKNPHKGICIRWLVRQNPTIPQDTQNSTFRLLNSLSSWKIGPVKDEWSLCELLSRISEETEKGYSSLSLQLLFLKIIVVLAELHVPEERKSSQEDELVKKSIIRKVEIMLDDQGYLDIDVNALAASLHMSYGHLSRVYRKITGKTILDRLCELRLAKARKYLEDSEYSMKEIAERLGFSNQYYFSRIFKEHYGVSPKEFRKNCTN